MTLSTKSKTLFSLIPAVLLVAGLTVMTGCTTSDPKKESVGSYIDDTAITTKVKAAIFAEPNLKSTEINIETFNGIVQLSGFVSSKEMANKAIEIAKGVSGVKSIRNDMRLK